MKNVIVVTNEPNIVDRYMSNLYKKPNVNVCPILDQVNSFNERLMCSWVDEENDIKFTRGILKPSESDGINIIKIPFSGFAYIVAYNRHYNLIQDQNIIISIKENIPTAISSQEKYHLFLDGKFNISIDIINECFNLNASNSLLSEDYDFIMDWLKEEKII